MTEVPDEAQRLERLLLGAQPEHTREEVAEATGVPLETARRFWRALGFPDLGDVAAFTDNDIAALRAVGGLMRTGSLTEEAAVRLVRGFGRTASRLADWQVDEVSDLIDEFESEEEHAGYGDDLRTAYHYAADLLPVFEDVLILAWRRHLARAVERVLANPVDAAGEVTMAVGFADLVGFTRVARGLDEDELGSLVEAFETRAADLVAAHDARLVKTLGDEVLFVSASPVVATDLGLALVVAVGDDPDMPDLRVGIATGAVTQRLGDVFGSTVNLASRLTRLAARNQVLVDESTSGLLAHHGGYLLHELPAQPVRGMGDVVGVVVGAANGEARLGSDG